MHEPDHSPSVLWQALIGDDPAQKVNFICLEGMTFSESDLRNLATLKQLRRLRLSHTKVSDAGLVHLEKLTQLESLQLWGTNVTESGVKKLKAVLPNCEFHTSFDVRLEAKDLVKVP